MNTRRLTRTAALMMALLAPGCAAPLDAPPSDSAEAGSEEALSGYGLPVAPPPRTKKTTTELLIGTWEAIELDGRKVPTGCVYQFTFEQDGQFHTFADDRPGRTRSRSGTYSIEGAKLRLQVTTEEGHRVNGVGAIIEISDTRLVFTSEFNNPEYGINKTRYKMDRVADTK
ncbi:lipocalin family protein [Gemmata sp. JC717]|uniref:Lipocalin family protein n=1 Tax=Gemmata algarum TaxID=2975278 RepID=A0ABU5F205_9BACT|nr:lipocalin family protein [Gemmata algarum]MDY3552689.1 lipocalin family protein [Gemmata algarum]MDY3559961.1 lipocalin family protein [Gemmata algarum]